MTSVYLVQSYLNAWDSGLVVLNRLNLRGSSLACEGVLEKWCAHVPGAVAHPPVWYVPTTTLIHKPSFTLKHIVPSVYMPAYNYHQSHVERWKQTLMHGIEIISRGNQSNANRLWMGIYYCLRYNSYNSQSVKTTLREIHLILCQPL